MTRVFLYFLCSPASHQDGVFSARSLCPVPIFNLLSGPGEVDFPSSPLPSIGRPPPAALLCPPNNIGSCFLLIKAAVSSCSICLGCGGARLCPQRFGRAAAKGGAGPLLHWSRGGAPVRATCSFSLYPLGGFWKLSTTTFPGAGDNRKESRPPPREAQDLRWMPALETHREPQSSGRPSSNTRIVPKEPLLRDQGNHSAPPPAS